MRSLWENKRVFIIAAGFVLVVLLLYIFAPDTAARFSWETAQSAPISLAFVQNDADLAAKLGSHYFGGKTHNLALAKFAYKKALRADPTIALAHYQLARIYFVEGKYEAALSEINKELQLYPENLRSLYVRGLIYGYRGDLAEAEADFARFVAWAPMEWAGYNDLAWVQLKAMRPERARGTLKNAFQVVPEGEVNPWLLNSLGVAEMNLGNRGAAFIALEKAQMLAEAMSEDEWAKAYPGNNPDSRDEGFRAFREAIAKNLKTVTGGD